MTAKKNKTERHIQIQPAAEESCGEQLFELIKRKGIPNISLPADEKGHAYINKEKYPELYDWAVNG